ncbi:tetratricopeptide repeat protein [Rothia mucilaginosa]|jgi:tetratricopeptide (TPR) repeat protein|uniref:tetratricopeptide repeat protein n=1 Tax=Rothia mucilaginosa TaxID=43675 RepID=UPI00128B4344|nr:hypothetical protein [Rothia mucilaginosa]
MMEISGKEDIKKYLRENLDDKNYQFSKNLSMLVEVIQCEDILIEILNECSEIEYPALYCLLTLYRKTNKRDEIENLLDKYFDKYSDSPMMWYFRSYIEKVNDLQGAIEDANKAVSIIEDPKSLYDSKYPGFYNHLAELLTLYAISLSGSDASEPIGYLEKALENIKIALSHEPKYPTYKANQSKIYRELGKNQEKEGDFEKALASYKNGISSISDGIKYLETKNKSIDYANRFNEYYKIFIEVSSLKNSVEMKIEVQNSSASTLKTIDKFIADGKMELEKERDSLERMKNEAAAEKIKTIEAVAFFSGVISFILTTASAAMSDKFVLKEKSYFICLMAACLIYIFCAFDIIFSRKFNLKNFAFYVMASLMPVIGCILSWVLL